MAKLTYASLVGTDPPVIAPAPPAIRVIGIVVVGHAHEEAPVVMVEMVHMRGAESVKPRRVTDVGSGDASIMHGACPSYDLRDEQA
jgi:hypothetical protein